MDAPSANEAVGLVPAYGILDLNGSYPISWQLNVRMNVNNVVNNHYFTKQPAFILILASGLLTAVVLMLL